MAISEFAALVGVLKAAREGLRSLRQSNLSSEHKSAVEAALDQLFDAQDRIATIQETAVALREENARLKQQIADADDWKKRVQDYKLVDTHGARVYLGGNPQHYACPACMERRELHVLQDRKLASGHWSCPGCKETYPIDPPSGFY